MERLHRTDLVRFTPEDAARLSELIALDLDGVKLTAEDYAEFNDLLTRENEAFRALHEWE